MKLRRILSGVLAVTVAISSVAMSAFTSFAADSPSDVVLPDSGKWSNTTVTNRAKLEFSPYNNDGIAVSALSGKTEFYATFEVTGVPDGGAQAYMPTVFIGGGEHWGADDTVPFVNVPSDGTYTVKYSNESIPDPAKLKYCGINFKSLINGSTDLNVGSITLKYVTLSDPTASSEPTVVKEYPDSYGGDLLGTLYSDGSLVFTGATRMGNYSDPSKAPWYGEKDLVTSIVVSEGVESVGDGSFNDMTNLKSVELASTVTTIGANAFAGSASDELVIDVKASSIMLTNKALNGLTAGTIKTYSKDVYDVILFGLPVDSKAQVYLVADGKLTQPEATALSGSCGDNATWTLTPNHVLTISGTGTMTSQK